MQRRQSFLRLGRVIRAVAALGLVIFTTSCDVLKPSERRSNAQVRSTTLGTIDASVLRPGQHLAGVVLLDVTSLGVGTTPSPIARAALYVDNVEDATTGGVPPFVLRLDTHRFPQGPHQLSVFVYEAVPNLGLAGLVGAPSQVLATTVVFDQTPPTPVTLSSLVWENGAPRLTWTQNADANFGSYQIVRDGNWGCHLPFPAPVKNQSATSLLDTLGLDALIGVQLSYHVNVDNRDALAPSNTLSLSVGTTVPGLRMQPNDPPPVPIPNSQEFYTYNSDSVRVFSSATHTLTRGFRPLGGSIVISRDGSTFILLSDVLLGGIPGLATYSATSFNELSRIQMAMRLGNNYAIAAGRADRVYLAGFEGLFVVRVSDAAVVGHIAFTPNTPRLAMSPDANTLYATTRDSLFKVDISTDVPQVLAALRVSPDIAGMELSPDGQRLYLGHSFGAPSNFVEILNTSTLAPVGSLTPPGNEQLFAFHVTSSYIYLSHSRPDIPNRFFLPGSVVQYDRASLTRLRSWNFVIVPSGLTGSADDQWFYASGIATWVVSATSPGPQLARR